MFLNKYKYYYLILILFTFSCTTNKEKIEVEGADSKVDSNISTENTDENIDPEIKIVDDISNEENKILTEKLIEVGDRVFFDYDESKFKKEGVETLKRQASFLLNNLSLTITIEGHCDARGTREYNLALGERRAYSVKSFLSSLGVAEDRISIISFGKEKLQSSGDDENAWAQSRTAITIINP
jgi:peptidoglycan-associated lipoprotein